MSEQKLPKPEAVGYDQSATPIFENGGQPWIGSRDIDFATKLEVFHGDLDFQFTIKGYDGDPVASRYVDRASARHLAHEILDRTNDLSGNDPVEEQQFGLDDLIESLGATTIFIIG